MKPYAYVCRLSGTVHDHGDVRCCGPAYPEHRPSPVALLDITPLVDHMLVGFGSSAVSRSFHCRCGVIFRGQDDHELVVAWWDHLYDRTNDSVGSR